MALPVSSKDLIRHQPGVDPKGEEDKSAPVYLVAVCTIMERARWQRDVAKAGARYVTNEDIHESLRRGCKEVLVPAAAEQAEGVLDDYEEMQKQMQTRIKTVADLEAAEEEMLGEGAELSPEQKEERDERRAILEEVGKIQQAIGDKYPEYTELVADRAYWWTVARLIACRQFLRGWERVKNGNDRPAEFRLHNNQVTEDCLELIPERAQLSIGARALILMAPEEAQAKN